MEVNDSASGTPNKTLMLTGYILLKVRIAFGQFAFIGLSMSIFKFPDFYLVVSKIIEYSSNEFVYKTVFYCYFRMHSATFRRTEPCL